MAGKSDPAYSITRSTEDTTSKDEPKFTQAAPSQFRIDRRYNSLDVTTGGTPVGENVVNVTPGAPFEQEAYGRVRNVRPASRGEGRDRHRD